ncbi:uncharacterized protein LOC118445615 [Vespa mandarinia]|uniref:uncharacterized protein LOC118445615 n=1 Tax=Vespa mandarinia TaxID=7446 RepID=UPI00161775DB|nr:uncharacterized protein LOC118445615 [Vespa mandarinia]
MTELNNICMEPDEHILQYISRVKDLQQAIYKEERLKSNGLSEEKINEIEEFSLVSFCEGLPRDDRIEIKLTACRDIFDAYEKAQEHNLMIEQDRLHHQRYKQTKFLRDRPLNSSRMETRDRQSWEINFKPTPKFCAHCNKIGHVKENIKYKESLMQSKYVIKFIFYEMFVNLKTGL